MDEGTRPCVDRTSCLEAAFDPAAVGDCLYCESSRECLGVSVRACVTQENGFVKV
jgi:hypothetical protein